MAVQKSIAKKLETPKAAIYIRVSTHWQVDKDSLQVQQRELIAYAQLVLGIDDYVVFEDAGYSAKNTDRPSLQEMMTRVRAGEFSHVLVWKIDRISRNLLDFASMYAELQHLGVIFISKNEQFDTSTAIGGAMLKIILVFAELERNMTSERVAAVMLSRANNGQWNGGRVPFGYQYNKEENVFSFDEREAAIVERIFRLYEGHRSCLYVANTLNKDGLLTRAGNKWSSVSIHKILTNPFYYGVYRYNIRIGTDGSKRDDSEWVTVEDHHPPFISKEQFNINQYRLHQNKRGGNQRGYSVQRKNVHIFAGLLECGHCGNAMTATPGKQRADGWAPSNYACSMRRKKNSECDSRFITDLSIAPFILGLISNILRARNTVDQQTAPAALEQKLLTGPAFGDVKHIDRENLNNMLALMKSGRTGIEYAPNFETSSADSGEAGIEALRSQRKKKANALKRLNSIFLYGDEDIPNEDFVTERKKLIYELDAIDDKLEALEDKAGSDYDDSFTEKASYFVMVEQLLRGDINDPASFIRSIDPSVVKSFLQTVIERIIIYNGKVSEIRFRNGVPLKFTYK